MRAYLLDFDGTITLQDVGDKIIENFAVGDYESVVKKWINREITTEQCAKIEWGMIDGPSDEMLDFIDSRKIDPYLNDFVSFCNKNGYSIYINSDGYDFYIKRILKKNDLNLKGYYNHVGWNDGWVFDFPYSDEKCGLCGNCKANVVKNFKSKNYEVIYIGDGYSDRCASGFADIVYAKEHLLDYCKKNNIPHKAFNNFSDILKSESNR